MSFLSISLQLIGLCIVLIPCSAFQPRLYLDPKTHAAWHWRAAVLVFAKRPFILMEICTKRDYVVTPKKGMAKPKYILLLPKALVVAAVTAAWIIGTLGATAGSGYLYSAAGLTIAGALSLVATGHVKFPDPYDAARRPSF